MFAGWDAEGKIERFIIFDDIISRRTSSNSMKCYISISALLCPIECCTLIPSIFAMNIMLIEKTSQSFMIYFLRK